MKTRVISRISGGIAVAAVLSLVAIVVWSVRNQQPEPTLSAPLTQGGLSMGDLTGYVGRVDRKARTVEVGEDTMTMTDDTTIMVHGKQGGLGDLTKDLPVRAFYEVRNDVKYVTSIQVVTDTAQASALAPAAPETRRPVETKSPPAVAAAPRARRQTATFKSAAPPAPAPAATPAPAPPPALTSASPLVPPITPAPPLTPAPVAEAPSPPLHTATAGRVVSDSGGDGSEAVDWLLRRRR